MTRVVASSWLDHKFLWFIYYLLTESEVIFGKYQTRPRSEIWRENMLGYLTSSDREENVFPANADVFPTVTWSVEPRLPEITLRSQARKFVRG